MHLSDIYSLVCQRTEALVSSSSLRMWKPSRGTSLEAAIIISDIDISGERNFCWTNFAFVKLSKSHTECSLTTSGTYILVYISATLLAACPVRPTSVLQMPVAEVVIYE